MPYAHSDSGRCAVIPESFWRSEPAEALRGFGAGGLPSATRRSFIARKPDSGMYTSPRTSTSGGASPFMRSGIDLIVRRFGVTSSPWTPSPRVAPRTKRPSS